MNKEVLIADFGDALARFSEAMAGQHSSDLEKAGCIQYFEFCFELAWKCTKLFAEEAGLNDCQSPKTALKCAFGQRWISDEAVWLDMLSSRNRMAHTYEAVQALAIYQKLSSYIPAFQELLENLSRTV
jgi:nucleotidyltransferase substrate binding protein (TIGR01987 family)